MCLRHWGLLMKHKLSSRVRIDVIVHIVTYVQHHVWRHPILEKDTYLKFEKLFIRVRL